MNLILLWILNVDEYELLVTLKRKLKPYIYKIISISIFQFFVPLFALSVCVRVFFCLQQQFHILSLHDDKMECFYICVHKIGNISEGTHFRSSIDITGLQSLSVVHSRWAKSVSRIQHTSTLIWALGGENKNKASQDMKPPSSVSVIQRMSSRVHNIVWFSLDKMVYVFLYMI